MSLTKPKRGWWIWSSLLYISSCLPLKAMMSNHLQVIKADFSYFSFFPAYIWDFSFTRIDIINFLPNKNFITFFFFFLKSYLSVLERERGRECQADFPMSPESGMGLDPTTLRSWPEQKPRVRCLSVWAIQVSPRVSSLSLEKDKHKWYLFGTLWVLELNWVIQNQIHY